MGWSKWIDLELPDDTRESMPFDLPAPKGPRYPWGMQLTFDDHCLEAAGLDMGDVDEGAEIDIRAFGKVIRFSNDEGRRSVTIQLTRIKVENEDEEDEEDEED